MEQWRSIEGCPDYEVSSLGRVRFIKILPLWKDEDGYLRTTVAKKQKSVARLVGSAFLPNPDNKPQIDHINRDKENNSVSNLRWATSSENNYNREHKISQSGHKHIYLTPEGTFRVHLKGFRKTFKLLDEALQARDEIMKPRHQDDS